MLRLRNFKFRQLVAGARTLHTGQSFTVTKTFQQSDIASFVALTGDANPIHVELQAAREAGFPGRPLPGILVASLFPALIGSTFPGVVYLSQTLRFRAPALEGTPVTATVTVTKSSGRRVTFATSAVQGQSLVLDGEALALLPNSSDR